MKIPLKYLIVITILISYQLCHSENKGLANCGNSCYFNASLQCLSHLDKFNNQLNENLYAENDLIPRFYVNLMNKIKFDAGSPLDAGNPSKKIISCNTPILSTGQTEEYFYKLVGDTFFKRQCNQEDAPEFIRLLSSMLVNKTSYFRDIEKLIKEEIDAIISKHYDNNFANQHKFTKTPTAPQTLTGDNQQKLNQIYQNFIKSFNNALSISKVDLSKKIIDKFMEILEQKPSVIKQVLLQDLLSQTKQLETAEEFVNKYKTNITNDFITASKSKTYTAIQIDTESDQKNIRVFTPTKDGSNWGQQFAINQYLNIMKSDLNESFNEASGSFWKNKKIDSSIKSIQALKDCISPTIRKEYKCESCKSLSRTKNEILKSLDLPIQIKTFDVGTFELVEKNLETLNAALAEYFKTTQPGNRCEICNNELNQESHIYKITPYLIISLKRFDEDNQKIGHGVKFGSNLNLTTYLHEDVKKKLNNKQIIYNLLAFVVQGGGTSGGHYWAYGKSKDEWWKYDDSSVALANINSIISSGIDSWGTPYILFYELTPESQSALQSAGLLEHQKPQEDPFKQKLEALKAQLQTLKSQLDKAINKLLTLNSKLK